MRASALAALALCLCACAAHAAPAVHTTRSPLERYQRLGPLLSASTRGDVALADDSRSLSTPLARGDVGRIQRWAITLKLAALAEMSTTGTVAGDLVALERAERDAVVRRYFREIESALSDEWWESRTLVRLADLIWLDPYLLDSRDARSFGRLDASARQDANQALHAAAYAAWLKWRYAGKFRYFPGK